MFIIIICEICNFADDNSLYACDITIDKVIQKLKKDIETAIKWFKYNHMVPILINFK